MNNAPPIDDAAGQKLIGFALTLTAAFVVVSLVTYVFEERFDFPYAVICSVLFAFGTMLLGLGFWNGIQRSRDDEVTLTGLLAVDKSHVPVDARNRLWLAVLVQVTAAVLFASLRPFTQQAFGLLVPALGLGFATLWGSRFAAFHPRADR